jgi:hypothetical protein
MFRILGISLLASLLICNFVQASELTAEERLAAMDKAMDCIETHAQTPGIGWADICDITSSYESAKGGRNSYYHYDQANIGEKMHSFEFGPEISFIKYEEPNVNVSEEGIMYGFKAAYNYRPDSVDLDFLTDFISVAHIDARGAFGQLDYEGSGTIDDISNYVFETRAWIGKDFESDTGARITPYVGVGYRTLLDDGGGLVSSTGAGAYDRRSQYVYIPAGFELRSSYATNGWQLGLDAEYDHLMRGWQDSDISGFLTDSGDLILADAKNTQDKGYGVRGALHIIKKGDALDIDISPYIRYWKIEDSDIDIVSTSAGPAGFYEPENESTEIGGSITAKF